MYRATCARSLAARSVGRPIRPSVRPWSIHPLPCPLSSSRDSGRRDRVRGQRVQKASFSVSVCLSVGLFLSLSFIRSSKSKQISPQTNKGTVPPLPTLRPSLSGNLAAPLCFGVVWALSLFRVWRPPLPSHVLVCVRVFMANIRPL